MRCSACQEEIPSVIRYVPLLDGSLREVRQVDQNAWRAHLRDAHARTNPRMVR